MNTQITAAATAIVEKYAAEDETATAEENTAARAAFLKDVSAILTKHLVPTATAPVATAPVATTTVAAAPHSPTAAKRTNGYQLWCDALWASMTEQEIKDAGGKPALMKGWKALPEAERKVWLAKGKAISVSSAAANNAAPSPAATPVTAVTKATSAKSADWHHFQSVWFAAQKRLAGEGKLVASSGMKDCGADYQIYKKMSDADKTALLAALGDS